MKKKIFLGLILCSFLSIFILTGCDNSKKIDIDNCIKVNYIGYDGIAKFEGKIDNSKLMQIPALQKLTDKMLNGDYKVTLKADKEKDLKNGDKIKLELDYNKDLYKRDFDVELVLKESEIEVKGLNKLISKESDLTQEQWNKLNNAVNKKVDEFVNDKNLKDKKLLCKVIYVKKDEMGCGVNYWYEFKEKSGKKIYLEAGNEIRGNTALDKVLGDKEDLYDISVGTSDNWNYINIDDSFNEVLDKYYEDSNYTVIK